MPEATALRWNIAGWLHEGSAENCPFAVGQTIFKVMKAIIRKVCAFNVLMERQYYQSDQNSVVKAFFMERGLSQ